MKKKATVVSYVMQKGGVAKTTTGKNSAEILGKEYKVLAIDNDQNAVLLCQNLLNLSGETSYIKAVLFIKQRIGIKLAFCLCT